MSMEVCEGRVCTVSGTGAPEGQAGSQGRMGESAGGKHSEVRLFTYPLLSTPGPASDSVLSPPPPGEPHLAGGGVPFGKSWSFS